MKAKRASFVLARKSIIKKNLILLESCFFRFFSFLWFLGNLEIIQFSHNGSINEKSYL